MAGIARRETYVPQENLADEVNEPLQKTGTFHAPVDHGDCNERTLARHKRPHKRHGGR